MHQTLLRFIAFLSLSLFFVAVLPSLAIAEPGQKCRLTKRQVICFGQSQKQGNRSNSSSNGNHGRDSGPNARGGDNYCPQEKGKGCAWLDVPSTGNRSVLPPPPVITESEFKKFKIPGSTINSLPGDSWGIAHRKTAFWADSSTRLINTTIVGYPVTIKATPRKYHWDFGDGNSLTTTRPGTKPRDINQATLYNVYKSAGNVTVNLTTTYSGMFKVGDGAWQSISGGADIPSTPVNLRVYRFHKYLVNNSCEQDPTGPDCGP